MITVTEEKSEFGAHVVAMFFLERELFLYTLQEFNKSFEKRWNLFPWNFQKSSEHQSSENPDTYLELSKTLWKTGS